MKEEMSSKLELSFLRKKQVFFFSLKNLVEHGPTLRTSKLGLENN